MTIRGRVLLLATLLVGTIVGMAAYFVVIIVGAQREMENADRAVQAVLIGAKSRVAMSRHHKEFHDSLLSGEAEEWEELTYYTDETRVFLDEWLAVTAQQNLSGTVDSVAALKRQYETNVERFEQVLEALRREGTLERTGPGDIEAPVTQEMLDTIDDTLYGELLDIKAAYRHALRLSGSIPWAAHRMEALTEASETTLTAFLAADQVRSDVLRQIQDTMDIVLAGAAVARQRLATHRAEGAIAINTWENVVAIEGEGFRGQTGWDPRSVRHLRGLYDTLQSAIDDVMARANERRLRGGDDGTEIGYGGGPEEGIEELLEEIEEELEDYADAALIPVLELSVAAYEGQLRGIHDEIRTTLYRGGLIGLVVALLVSTGIIIFTLLSARMIVHALDQLRAGAERVAAGIWEDEIALGGVDEFRLLSDAFDEMLERLRATTTSVHNLEREIEERIRTEEALEGARDVAERAAESKTQFLANMSHEIRTPMNGVIGMTGLLLNTEISEIQREYLVTIQRSADSLLAIINDVLDFSKIDAGKLELDVVNFNLRRQLESMNDILAWRAQEKGLEYTFLIEEGVCEELRGDPGRIQQVLTNLVSNAVKFTHHGDIAVRVKLVEELEDRIRIEFNVVDTGIGIDETKIDELFNAFTQADTTTTREYGGTGLGLSISKRLVDLMDGEIGAESNQGEGARFWFSVVLERQPGDQAPQVLPERRALATITDAYILIVDDNATNRLVLKRQLDSWGFRYDEASGAQMALHKLRDAHARGNPFTLAILDMQMPYMDGEALGQAIKQDPILESTILIMMTSIGWRRESERMREAGFASYLTKPVKQSQLFDCMATALGVRPPKRQSSYHDPLAVEHKLTLEQRRATRLLLVEDNPTNQIVALSILKNWGFHVDAVDCAEDGLDALANSEYDLVLMDVQMPGMDGLEATRRIRAADSPCSNPRIPIVAMTAHALKGDREKCIKSGMDDYVTKPIKVQELLQVIERQTLPPVAREPAAVHEARQEIPGEPAAAERALQALLLKIGEDLDLVAVVLRTFREDSDARVAALRKAAETGDTEQIAEVAHALKSAAGNVGAARAFEIAVAIEEGAKGGDAEELPARLDELESALETFHRNAQAWLDARQRT